ncbi:MAG: hypothetical protein M3313_14520, partial [Actinomycetota bacterium]|nr:hypothetical protein [Actinomycetota bacterium]
MARRRSDPELALAQSGGKTPDADKASGPGQASDNELSEGGPEEGPPVQSGGKTPDPDKASGRGRASDPGPEPVSDPGRVSDPGSAQVNAPLAGAADISGESGAEGAVEPLELGPAAAQDEALQQDLAEAARAYEQAMVGVAENRHDPEELKPAVERALAALTRLRGLYEQAQRWYYPDWEPVGYQFSTPAEVSAVLERIVAQVRPGGNVFRTTDIDESWTSHRSTIPNPELLEGAPAILHAYLALGVQSGWSSGRAATQLMELFGVVAGDGIIVQGLFGAQTKLPGRPRPIHTDPSAPRGPFGSQRGLFGAQRGLFRAPQDSSDPQTELPWGGPIAAPELMARDWTEKLIRFRSDYYTPQHEAAGIVAFHKLGPDGEILMTAYDAIHAPDKDLAKQWLDDLTAKATEEGFIVQGGAGVIDLTHPGRPASKATGLAELFRDMTQPPDLVVWSGDSSSDEKAGQGLKSGVLGERPSDVDPELWETARANWPQQVIVIAAAGPQTKPSFAETADLTVRSPAGLLDLDAELQQLLLQQLLHRLAKPAPEEGPPLQSGGKTPDPDKASRPGQAPDPGPDSAQAAASPTATSTGPSQPTARQPGDLASPAPSPEGEFRPEIAANQYAVSEASADPATRRTGDPELGPRQTGGRGPNDASYAAQRRVILDQLRRQTDTLVGELKEHEPQTVEELNKAGEDAAPVADQALVDLTLILDEVNDNIPGPGLWLAKVECRVKAVESFTRDYAKENATSPLTASEFLSEVTDDLVRFSVVTPAQSYAPTVSALLSALTDRGYAVAAAKNYWRTGNRFPGLNITLTTPTGQRMEVQFPTETSLDLSDLTHPDYQVLRLPGVAVAVRVEAFANILKTNMESGIDRQIPDTSTFAPPVDTRPIDNSPERYFRKHNEMARHYRTQLAREGLTVTEHLLGAGFSSEIASRFARAIEGAIQDAAQRPDLLPGDRATSSGPGESVRGGAVRGTSPSDPAAPSDQDLEVRPGDGSRQHDG